MLSFRKYVHHLLIEDEFIIFDEVRDKYLILDKKLSNELLNCLDGDDAYHIPPAIKSKELLQAAGDRQLISSVPLVRGLDSYEWHLRPAHNSGGVTPMIFCRAFRALISLKSQHRRKGLHILLEDIRTRKSAAKASRGHAAFGIEEANQYAAALNLGSRYLPFRVKCLETSLALMRMLVEKNPNIQFKIGVQRYNFMAHAWVELNGKVIGDDPVLTSRLPVILTI